jgi:hypothetical protein
MPHEISKYLRTKSVRTAGTTLKINLPCGIKDGDIKGRNDPAPVVSRPSTLGRNLASLSAEGRPGTPYDYSRRIGLQIGNGADPAEQVTQLRDKFSKWHYVTTCHNCMQSTHVALLTIPRAAIYAFLAPPTYTAEATITIDPRRVQLFPKATFAEGQIDSPSQRPLIF